MKLETLSKSIEDINKGIVSPPSDEACLLWIIERNTLLMKSLTMSMFVPCKDGVPLEKPKDYSFFKDMIVGKTYTTAMTEAEHTHWIASCKAYEEAEKLVIFEGFVFNKDLGFLIGDEYRIDVHSFSLYKYNSPWNVQKVAELETISDLATATQNNPITLRP